MPHAMYNAPERLQWREDHAALITWVQNAGTSEAGFLADMRRDIAHYGWLTHAQTAVVERLMNNSPAASVAPGEPALQNDLPNIFNGVYTLNDGTEHLTYRIHTVQRGPLQGKRIIKIQQQYGEFKGFAFLTREGWVKVWRSYAEAARRNEKFIVWASILLEALRWANDNDESVRGSLAGPLVYTLDGVEWEVQASLCCRRCNRPLTNPSSIDAGLGPECASRSNDRTTAAAQHETVGTAIGSAEAGEPLEVSIGPVEVIRVAMDIIEGSTLRNDDTTTNEQPYPTEAELVAAREVQYRNTEQGNDARPFADLFQRLNWRDQQRCCRACGRLFASRAGVARHRSSCTQRNRAWEIENRQRGPAVTPQPRMRRVPRTAPTPAGPRLSALGTRIDGRVWEQ